MHGTYLQNKKSIYNYRDKNADKIREILKKSSKKQYEWKKIRKIYLAILLN